MPRIIRFLLTVLTFGCVLGMVGAITTAPAAGAIDTFRTELNPNQPVLDTTGVLTAEQLAQMSAPVLEVSQKHGIELYVVVIDKAAYEMHTDSGTVDVYYSWGADFLAINKRTKKSAILVIENGRSDRSTLWGQVESADESFFSNAHFGLELRQQYLGAALQKNDYVGTVRGFTRAFDEGRDWANPHPELRSLEHKLTGPNADKFPEIPNGRNSPAGSPSISPAASPSASPTATPTTFSASAQSGAGAKQQSKSSRSARNDPLLSNPWWVAGLSIILIFGALSLYRLIFPRPAASNDEPVELFFSTVGDERTPVIVSKRKQPVDPRHAGKVQDFYKRRDRGEDYKLN